MGNRLGLEVMREIVFLFVIILCGAAVSAQKPVAKIFSPDKKYRAEFFFKDSVLCYCLKDNAADTFVISASKTGFVLDTNFVFSTLKDTLLNIKKQKYSAVLRNDFGERKFQEDKYTVLRADFKNGGVGFQIQIRLYNRALAVRYIVKTTGKRLITADKTEFNLSRLNLIYYSEYRVEDGYRSASSDLYNNLTPLFVTDRNRKFSFLINEAANFAQASKMRVTMKKGVYMPVQSFKNDTMMITPWRYIIYGSNPKEMVENKYVIHSLNFPTDKDTSGCSWIKPGTVYRYALQNYSFDLIKNSIDFCAENSIKYLLFDAGWYGNENDKKSSPFFPAGDFDVKKTSAYAAEKNIGIMLYVNQTAWYKCNKKQLLDTFQLGGVSGVKLGFMAARSHFGLASIYDIVDLAKERKMLVNVHDEMRPTGTEIIYKNMMTFEGVRGNEYTDNWAYHTMLLPFARCMTGATDYTICYPGYPEYANGKVSQMRNSKCHQMALSVILFSPLQHIFWYGQPFIYTKKEEIEFFKGLPTVWDDFKVIDGDPGRYFSIARKSGKKWYLAAACFSAREFNVAFDFLDPKEKYTAVIYEDDGKNGVKITRGVSLTKDTEMGFSLKPSGGMTAIIEEMQE
ncbi:MAG: glycoside hydrolase family 97 catalytic domain-containing protein [Bacteroidales bacterium]|nr:glycoside hydrolase family 97 catalytic domain-containing protein [Bacteroidales bacterium]